MKCDKCEEEANPVFGFDGTDKNKKVMGHYCSKCILYVRREIDGFEKEARVIKRFEREV